MLRRAGRKKVGVRPSIQMSAGRRSKVRVCFWMAAAGNEVPTSPLGHFEVRVCLYGTPLKKRQSSLDL